MKRSGKTTWFLRNIGVEDAVIGDLVEQSESGRSDVWLWRQVLMACVHGVRTHAVLLVGSVLLGWAVLLLFFRFVGVPVADALIERDSAGWWLRSVVMWVVVAIPFFASGWMVAKVAARRPLLPVLTFALSIGATTAIALIADTPASPFDLRVWLTVPLFLMVAPATAVGVGGFVAARR